jgi:hypothetical protein
VQCAIHYIEQCNRLTTFNLLLLNIQLHLKSLGTDNGAHFFIVDGGDDADGQCFGDKE